MTFSGRIIHTCGIALVACAVLGGSNAVSAAVQPSPPPKNPLVVSAIGALDAERGLLAERPAPGQPIPAALRNRIRQADDSGVRLLEQLRHAGYGVSPSLEAALGPLPRPDAAGQVTLPGPNVYQRAIDELETARPAADDGGSSRTSVMNLLVAAVVVLATLVVLLVILMSRRRHDSRLAELAHSDSLTGLANRRRLDDDLQACRRDKRMPVAVMMVDVDNFKVVNDTHGHAAGDRILQAIGALLAGVVRSKDVVYRYGGEEFCILLPGASAEEAVRVAERICCSTADMVVPVGGNVTVSVGVAIGVAADVIRTLGQADAALYEAKHDGRNRVVLASSDGARHREGTPVGG